MYEVAYKISAAVLCTGLEKRASIVAHHDHVISTESFFERAFQLGRYQLRLGAKVKALQGKLTKKSLLARRFFKALSLRYGECA